MLANYNYFINSFGIAVATICLVLLSQNANAEVIASLAKRTYAVDCSAPNGDTGEHCATLNENAYSNVPGGSSSSYQCSDYDPNTGKGIDLCGYNDGQFVILACDTKDESQLEVTFAKYHSYVSQIQGNYITWYWESEANAGTYAGNKTTYYSDDNIVISCTGSKY